MPGNESTSGERSNSSALPEIREPSDLGLTEDLALGLLKRADLPGETIERLSKNGALLKSRKVKLALVTHPHAPRHVSLPIARHLFTFELMQVSLTPAVPADLKAAADETLINRLETISSGERLSLAHRASGRIAGELLLDSEVRVIQAALENSRLTEAGVIRAVMRPEATSQFVQHVCQHPKWSPRREVRIALLRNQHTPMARALQFARSLPAATVREILEGSRLPENVKECLLTSLA
ncbi:MAG TPA: hypothetical protein VGF06_00690 [Terriglobales bacterium]|jgi:hypothetical protein